MVFSLSSVIYHDLEHPPFLSLSFSSVQSLSPAWGFVTPWAAAHQNSLSITNLVSSKRALGCVPHRFVLRIQLVNACVSTSKILMCSRNVLLSSYIISPIECAQRRSLAECWKGKWCLFGVLIVEYLVRERIYRPTDTCGVVGPKEVGSVTGFSGLPSFGLFDFPWFSPVWILALILLEEASSFYFPILNCRAEI